MGQYSQALKYFQQALVIAKEVGNKTQEGTTLNNIGAVYNSLKQYSNAEKMLLAAIQVWESLRQGLTDADKISIFDKQAHTYNFLQHSLIAQNKTKTALEIAERGRARAFVELLSKRLSSQSTEQLMLNTDSSRLKVTASLIRVDQGNQAIAQVFPTRALGQLTASVRGNTNRSNFFKLPVKTPVQLQITNNESRPLYLCVLVIDSSGEMTIIFPNQWTSTGESIKLEAGQTLLIPEQNRDSFNLQTQEPLGMTEILIIASVTPLRSSLKALQAIGR